LFCFQTMIRASAFLVPLESSLQGGVHRLCFVVFGLIVWKLLNLKVLMNLKTELNYILYWKNHNFHVSCPNATKQSPCTPLYIKLSIHIKNTNSHTTTKLLHLCVHNKYWIAKLFQIQKFKKYIYFYFGLW